MFVMALNLEIPTCNEWHVLKGETKYGPYTYQEMIQMLQNKTLFNFDYAWGSHLDSWTSLAELPEFSQDRLTRIAEKETNEEIFNKRKHTRVTVEIPVYAHDNLRLWKGKVENLSEGGALIYMENPLLLPGHIINLHFKSLGKDEVAFNCTAEILTKRLTKQRIQHDTGIHYAVQFLQIPDVGNSQIENWIKEKNKSSDKQVAK